MPKAATATVAFLLALCGCKPSEESRMKAVIGAVLMDGAGGPPVTDSVVVVAGDRINSAGPRTATPVPAAADKIDGYGKFLVPALVDVYPGAEVSASFTAPGGYPDGALQPTMPDAARARVAELATRRGAAIHMWLDDRGGTRPKLPRATAEAVLKAAREAGIPVTAHIVTQADAKFAVSGGAGVLIGMIRDTADLDADFVARLRDLPIVCAPALASEPPGTGLEIARRNTRALFAAGVPLALASGGGDLLREAELIASAGVPALDVVVAATHNGAVALRQLDRMGTIQPGKRADFLLLSANPGEDIRNLGRVAGRMRDGEWTTTSLH